MYDIADAPTLDKYKRHSIEVVVDRYVVRHAEAPEGAERAADGRPIDPETGLVMPDPDASRLADSIETALRLGEGAVLIAPAPRDDEPPAFEEQRYSEKYSCPYDGFTIDELEPRNFSFNSPHGACPACTGLGTKLEIDPALLIPNPDKSLGDGALGIGGLLSTDASWRMKILEAICEAHGWDFKAPVRKLPKEALDYLLYAKKDQERVLVRYRHERGESTYKANFEGIIANLERRYRESESDYIKAEIEKFMVSRPCPVCGGKRLRPEILAVTIGDRNVYDVATLSIKEALRWATGLGGDAERPRAGDRLPGASRRSSRGSGFLVDVGLDYLTMDRTSVTLSGGEAQRIRLATQIGTTLMGVLYILDEPSIGLHQRDNAKLIATLTRLRDLGQHGPRRGARRGDDPHGRLGRRHRAGRRGARRRDHRQRVARGPARRTAVHHRRVPARRAPGARSRQKRRKGSGKALVVKGAREHNLQNVDLRVPLGTFVSVTGVSGSGKSTLVTEVLYRALARELNGSREPVGAHDKLLGAEHIDKIIEIDQSPIGRTPRSNPATYTGLFGPIRELFAGVPESRLRGYSPGRFSFNVKGGRCENCKGDGILKIEMQFLPDVYVPCEVCKGKRYNREALEIHFKGKSIADVLEMTIAEALEFFSAVPNVRAKLQTLYDVGLGYVHLGQPATTLSGGEAQRVKLSTELSRRATGRTLYVLDEPTTGLHFADVEKLLEVLHRLVDGGNTVLVIEHNLDVIKTADWIVDLGPEGGDRGGRIIAEGTPEKVAAIPGSATGEYLDRVLRGEPLVPLSDVSFAEEAGRAGHPDHTNGHAREAVPVPATPSRKRATAATKAR